MLKAMCLDIIAASSILAAGFYLDNKRTSAPEYRTKLKAKKAKDESKKEIKNTSESETVNYPNLLDNEAIRAFHNNEMMAAEKLIQSGEVERGIERISNALVVNRNPWKYLQGMHSKFSDRRFHLLLIKIEQAAILLHKSTSRHSHTSQVPSYT